MRMDRYDKYKRLKLNSRTERMLRYIEDVYNNIVDYSASIVVKYDNYIDTKFFK